MAVSPARPPDVTIAPIGNPFTGQPIDGTPFISPPPTGPLDASGNPIQGDPGITFNRPSSGMPDWHIRPEDGRVSLKGVGAVDWAAFKSRYLDQWLKSGKLNKEEYDKITKASPADRAKISSSGGKANFNTPGTPSPNRNPVAPPPSGSGRSGRSQWDQPGGGNVTTTPPPSNVAPPGGIPGQQPGTGGIPFDPNAPLGFTNPGPGQGPLPGQTGQSPFSRPGNIFQGMPQNPNYWDVMGSVMNQQMDTREAQQRTLGMPYQESLGGNSQGTRNLVNQLNQNPFSLDAATVAQMKGRNTDAITQRTNVMEQAAQAGAASRGVGRSGVAQGQLSGIRNRAAQQIGEGERSIDIAAAQQRGQDIRSAIDVGGASTRGDLGFRGDLARASAGALGESQVFGDAFLQNMMMGGTGQGQGLGYRMAQPGLTTTWNGTMM